MYASVLSIVEVPSSAKHSNLLLLQKLITAVKCLLYRAYTIKYFTAIIVGVL